MRCPHVSLWGVLWLWLPLAGGRPLRPDKVQADTRNLTRTLSTRIRHLQLLPVTLRIRGLEVGEEVTPQAGGVPEGGGVPEAGLGALAQRLPPLQRLLGTLAPGHPPLAQVANDTENLRSLLLTLVTLLGCPLPAVSPPPGVPPRLAELVAEAPHTVAAVALARLRDCLDAIATRLDGPPAC
ncbi:hypothetical protein Q9233_013253 [Columba guinea]|nr:hypothetical protein Q9233_013253 [Columba guinea]